MIGLSKSKLLSSLQCKRRIWLEIHCPELAEEADEVAARLDAGHAVGEVARKLAGAGALIETQEDLGGAIAETRRLLATGASLLFEATFQADRVLVRADILRMRRGRARIEEVKSSTSVKDHYLNDVAIQRWVVAKAGINVESAAVTHLNGEFVYPGDGDYEGLFTKVDVTAQTRGLLETVPDWILATRRVLKGPEPEIPMGPQCKDPWPCPFSAYCRSQVPQPELPLSLLPNASRSIQALLAEGFDSLEKVPAGRLTENQERVRRVHISGKAEYDPAARQAIKSIGFPRAYLDFETIGHAVPVWKGTRPWQQVPFQYSLIVEGARGSTRHFEFLDTSGGCPAAPLAEGLVGSIPPTGPVLAYNSGFEGRCLDTLASLVPRQRKALLSIRSRLVDLLPITKKHWYHPAMQGSWSIKAVLPTIPGARSYESLDEVADGGSAQAAWMEASAPGTSSSRRAELRRALLEYCKLDTEAMVHVARFLKTGA